MTRRIDGEQKAKKALGKILNFFMITESVGFPKADRMNLFEIRRLPWPHIYGDALNVVQLLN